MEKDDMVRVTKKCPYCGATSPYRRVRKGGYHLMNANKIPIIRRSKRSDEYFNVQHQYHHKFYFPLH